MLGKITGKTTPTSFTFDVTGSVQNLEYVQVYHEDYGYVLCQVVELEKEEEQTTAECQVIGYSDEGKVKVPRVPFDPGTEVLDAEDDFITETIQIEQSKRGGYIGQLSGRSIDVNVDLNKILTKHMSVLAKSGSGKSYTVGVLLEEIIEKGIPVLVIDPHGEYGSLRRPNPATSEVEKLRGLGLKPRGYNVTEWGDPDVVKNARKLSVPHDFSSKETVNILPKKPTGAQLAVLYNALKKMNERDVASLIHTVDLDDSNSKYQLIGMLEHLESLDIFTNQSYDYGKFLEPGKCNILNFKGFEPYVQELVTYKVVKELFEKRKRKEVPPFFLVIEEAHNFCPERSFGEKKCSDILRTVASEGRKFGLGLSVISQRPARVDKNVLSQCSTQIIMKITNPNDLRAVSKSVENITDATQDELPNLEVGTGLVTGINEMPIMVDVRPRRSQHGGEAEKIFVDPDREGDEDREKELVNAIHPATTYEDVVLMADDDVSVKIVLHPCTLFTCGPQEAKVLVSRVTGNIITDVENGTTKRLPQPSLFQEERINTLQRIHSSEEPVQREELHPDAVAWLEQEGYVEEGGETAELTENYIYENPEAYHVSFAPGYKEVFFDEKLEEEIEDAHSLLDPYTDIEDEQDVFLVQYKYE